MAENQAWAWLDGDVRPLAEMRVKVEDRGYLFADGVYEVIRSYGGAMFAAQDHLERLERSAAGISLALPFEASRFEAIARELMDRGGLTDAEIYIQVTRGHARRHHLFPEGTPPSALVWAQALRPLSPALREAGVQAITLQDERWKRCHLKTISLANVLAKEAARAAGAYEALLIRDGVMTEGTSCNAFLVKDGVLISPVTDWRILPGITRDHLLAIAAAEGVRVELRDVPEAEVAAADEIFLTSTIMEIVPVVGVDGRPVGDGAVGPVTRRLIAAFNAHVAASAQAPAASRA